MSINRKALFGFTVVLSMSVSLGLVDNIYDIVEASEESVVRIQGNDRYETSALISQKSYLSSDTVFIANAMNFADALAGVPLAYQQDAPILMAYGTKLKASVVQEIERLGANKAVILGGEAAISQSIENELSGIGLSIQRISGDDRFETSALIADELEMNTPTNKAVVVDGMNFADAMSIAPFAAQENMPIYLTKTQGLQNAEELDAYSKTYIVGGENAVSYNVEAVLNNVTRLAGLDRYETNREVINHFGFVSKELYVATGLNFADALTGSVLAARQQSAVALVKGDVHPKLLNYLDITPVNGFIILGGEAAVSMRVEQTLESYFNPIYDPDALDLPNPEDLPLDDMYIELNNNIPFFTNEELEVSEPFHTYEPLDELGRVGVAEALLDVELMPADERGSIGHIQPTGWNQWNYDIVPGGWLYNRSHLIGHQLTGYDGRDNLMTGTRQFNVEGMLPFENFVASVVEDTEMQVRYRITPIFEEDNLLAHGIIMEGFSLDDNGASLTFNIFVPNQQDGIELDYRTGAHQLAE